MAKLGVEAFEDLPVKGYFMMFAWVVYTVLTSPVFKVLDLISVSRKYFLAIIKKNKAKTNKKNVICLQEISEKYVFCKMSLHSFQLRLSQSSECHHRSSLLPVAANTVDI